MKLVDVTQRVREGTPVPPGQSLASRPVVQPACVLARGGVKPGESRTQAALLSPEIKSLWSDGISAPVCAGKPTPCHRAEGSSARRAFSFGERRAHHRGLRAGHVFTGVTRELGRAVVLLAETPGKKVARLPIDLSRAGCFLPRASEEKGSEGKVPGSERDAKRLGMGRRQS